MTRGMFMQTKSLLRRRKVVLLTLLVTMLILAIGYMGFAAMFGIYPQDISAALSRSERLLPSLQENEGLWRSHHITHYRINIDGSTGFNTFTTVTCPAVVIEVRDQKAVGIGGQRPQDKSWTEDAHWRKVCLDFYNNWTIEELFRLANKALHTHPLSISQIELEYNDAYGYITYILYIPAHPMIPFPGDASLPPQFFKFRLSNLEVLEQGETDGQN